MLSMTVKFLPLALLFKINKDISMSGWFCVLAILVPYKRKLNLKESIFFLAQA